MNTTRRIKSARVKAVVDRQLGDTAKGKVIDYLAPDCDVVARGTGGANAGHTVCHGAVRLILRLVPSAILHDAAGVVNVIGTGVAFNPRIVFEEVRALRAAGIACAKLKASRRAKLVLPQHLALDWVREKLAGAGKIGTTLQGIMPCLVDHYARIGLIVDDLLNPDRLVRKLRRNLQEKVRLLQTLDPQDVADIMRDPALEGGRFYNAETIFDVDSIVSRYLEYAAYLEPMIEDTDEFMREAYSSGKRILLEGAQGDLLSVNHGTYPFVTSSDCTLPGLAEGVGLHERCVDLTLGVIKGFYMTRVGGGPFPTELGGERSAEWCSSGIREAGELEAYPNPSINSPDEFEQGIAMRQRGREFGSMSGRPRRTGWQDRPLFEYTRHLTPGRSILVMTKLDVLDDCKRIKVCTSHEYVGPRQRLGGLTLMPGTKLRVAIPEADVLSYCKPLYETIPGWLACTNGARRWQDLPPVLRGHVRRFEAETKTKVGVLSVGPDREQTIIVE